MYNCKITVVFRSTCYSQCVVEFGDEFS